MERAEASFRERHPAPARLRGGGTDESGHPVISGGNRPGEARDHFEAAIRYHPDYGLGHYNFGLMLMAQNRVEEARGQMELALQDGSGLDAKTRESAQQRLAELRNRR